MLRRHLLSTNGGSNWVALAARSQQQAGEHAWLLPQYMRQGGRMGTQISDLKIDPFDSDRAVYGTGFGVFMTGNLRAAQQAGASVDWQFVVRHLELATASELTSPSEGATLVAAMNMSRAPAGTTSRRRQTQACSRPVARPTARSTTPS